MEYENIFNRAKAAYGTGAYDDATLEFIFPELAESEDEKIRKVLIHIVKSACSKYGIKYIGDKITEEMLLAYLEKQKEQKPAENGGKELLYVSNKSYNIGFRDGKREAEQKPAEWSEEDEKQIRQIERIVKNAGCTQKLQEQIHNWLKSLRPSHWNPSEEHLSALLAIISDPNNIGSQTCQLALTDLYEQLKKL